MFCPRCLNEVQRTKWKPTLGYDPLLVEYKCGNCKHTFYALTGSHYKVADADQEALELDKK